jgi:small subunit ribosomal protein S4e
LAKLKRLRVPGFWKISKKEMKWVVSPRPGPHPKFYSIPLLIIVRNMLGLGETAKEAKSIIKNGEVLVDNKSRKDHAYPVGLFDVVSFPKIKKFYRVVPNPKGLVLIEISADEATKKICRIDNKTLVEKGKMQLNLHDGKNILVDNKNYKTGDSILIELPSLKILQHISLAQGNLGLISKGLQSGKVGKIKEVIPGKMREKTKIVCELDKETKEIVKDMLFVVGKDKPVVSVSE